MKKQYIQPVIKVIELDVEATLLAGSDGNQISGTIHSDQDEEQIGTGNENDDEGTEGSAKYHAFDIDC